MSGQGPPIAGGVRYDQGAGGIRQYHAAGTLEAFAAPQQLLMDFLPSVAGGDPLDIVAVQLTPVLPESVVEFHFTAQLAEPAEQPTSVTLRMAVAFFDTELQLHVFLVDNSCAAVVLTDSVPLESVSVTVSLYGFQIHEVIGGVDRWFAAMVYTASGVGGVELGGNDNGASMSNNQGAVQLRVVEYAGAFHTAEATFKASLVEVDPWPPV